MAELPDAGKWFTGFFDVTRYIKDFGTILRAVLIVTVAYLLFVGGVAVWKKFIPSKPKPVVHTIESITGGDNSKCDLSSGERVNKFGFITF